MRHGQIMQGIFRPVITSDLPEQARDLIGSRHYFRVLYRIDEGPYAGRYACETVDRNGEPDRSLGGYSVPDSDIVIEDIDVDLIGGRIAVNQ